MNRPPSVDKLARSLAGTGLPHPLLVEVARQAIADDRVDQAEERARSRARRLLTPVINATGVLLHTNLGRAPFGVELEAGYTNLELSLETGKRGSRQRAVGDLLATACGAEAAMVVNNCAGGVLLTLAALGAGRGVAVSRGEMVEIGGGFRIPDVMAQSGARLVEVGTTNRSRRADYAGVCDDHHDVAMILKVHRSNYKIVGFTEDAEVPELADLGVPVVADVGSGLLDASCPWLTGPPPAWLTDEPAARQTLDAGAALVLFSGDKLFGGPQAGVIAGRRELVERCAKHPLARALRPGDLVLRALQDITLAYLERRGDDIPFWRLASRSVETLEQRARRIVDQIGQSPDRPRPVAVAPAACASVPGGGTLPTVTIPSYGLRIDGDLSDDLRNLDRPIIGRVEQGQTWLDLRTVEPDDDGALVEALGGTAGGGSTGGTAEQPV
jgi:L-seryl-tRNA(Ser) seleniumtransferase